MQDRAVKEGFQPLQKASTMPTSPRAPPAAPSIDQLRIGDMADLRAQDLSKLYTFAEDREEIYISRLREAVAIKGVSAWVENRPKIVEMLEWAKAWAERLGAAEARFVENPKKGEDATLPPLLLITFAAETNLPHDKVRTVCAYGHLDVQPAKKDDGWDSEPFVLTETADGRLVGRGASDDKGPALSWLWVVEAHRKLDMKLPVRLKLLYEGMEEFGSEGLPEFVAKEAVPPQPRFNDIKREITLDFKNAGWLSDVDHFVISDNQWLAKKTPCLTYGLRGVAYFEVVVSGPAQDLHSGVYGGSVHEPLNDLIHLLATLRHPPAHGGMHHERIRVPGLLDDVPPVTDDERKKYATLDFDVEQYNREDVTGAQLENATNEKTLMARWRFPTLSIHGIEGAFSDPGAKTVLPRRVSGKFSIRQVPNMTSSRTEALVTSYLESQWAALGSKYALEVKMVHGGPAWVSRCVEIKQWVRLCVDLREPPTPSSRRGHGDNVASMAWGARNLISTQVSRTDHPNYVAASRAVTKVFGKPPDLTREGGSIPVANWLADATGMNVLLLPTSASNDGAHAQNEKWDKEAPVNAVKILGTYLHEISKLVGPRPALCKCAPPTAEDLAKPGFFAFAKGFRCKCEL